MESEKDLLDSLMEQATGLVEVMTGLLDKLETLSPSQLIPIAKKLVTLTKLHRSGLILYGALIGDASQRAAVESTDIMSLDIVEGMSRAEILKVEAAALASAHEELARMCQASPPLSELAQSLLRFSQTHQAHLNQYLESIDLTDEVMPFCPPIGFDLHRN